MKKWQSSIRACRLEIIVAIIFGKFGKYFFFSYHRSFFSPWNVYSVLVSWNILCECYFRQLSLELIPRRKIDLSKKICFPKLWRHPEMQLTKRLFGMTKPKGTIILNPISQGIPIYLYSFYDSERANTLTFYASPNNWTRLCEISWHLYI